MELRGCSHCQIGVPDREGAPCRAGDNCSRLPADQRTGCDIPGLDTGCPVGIQSTAGDVAEVQRSGTQATDALGDGQYLKKLLHICGVAIDPRGKAAGDQSFSHSLTAAHRDRYAIFHGWGTLHGRKGFLRDRIMDDADLCLATKDKGDGDTVSWESVGVIGGSIYRIDQPGWSLRVRGGVVTIFFTNPAEIGKQSEESPRDQLLCLDVGIGHQIAGSLFPRVRPVSHLLDLAASLDSGRLGDE